MKLSPEKRKAYDKYLDNLDHYKGEIHTAWDGGWAGGEKGKERKFVLGMHEDGLPKERIAKIAELTVAEVEAILMAH